MLIYSMKPGHDGSVALIDTDTQDLRQEVKKDITKLELKIGWVKSELAELQFYALRGRKSYLCYVHVCLVNIGWVNFNMFVRVFNTIRINWSLH